MAGIMGRYLCPYVDHRDGMQGSVSDMVQDVQTGIGWVLRNIGTYGGDLNNVYVMGQSCGGHLLALALLKQLGVARACKLLPDDFRVWSTEQIKVLLTRARPLLATKIHTCVNYVVCVISTSQK
jgi:hypothetical protein